MTQPGKFVQGLGARRLAPIKELSSLPKID
jgi:hypothetical protein